MCLIDAFMYRPTGHMDPFGTGVAAAVFRISTDYC